MMPRCYGFSVAQGCCRGVLDPGLECREAELIGLSGRRKACRTALSWILRSVPSTSKRRFPGWRQPHGHPPLSGRAVLGRRMHLPVTAGSVGLDRGPAVIRQDPAAKSSG
jgi:hypothetical protein